MARIDPVRKEFNPLGLGCWVFDTRLWNPDREIELINTMEAALENGLNHFDTASGYGSGSSESLVGRFLQGRREQIFLASKAGLAATAQGMLENLHRSLDRLRVDSVDLYYIHWPSSEIDMRPAMQGLETARQKGLLRAVGVSNFTVAQMELVAQEGRIDAHQLGYNLFWRHRERDVIAYCRERAIPLVTYASIAQGILTGKFPRDLHLAPSDHRYTVLYFHPEIWPHIYAATEQLKALAEEVGCPLHHLAIRWTLAQPGIVSALVGARSPRQAAENAAALLAEIPPGIFTRMTAISDEALRHIPDTGNMYGVVS
jgi:myo-inositol catabolism protein IolS